MKLINRVKIALARAINLNGAKNLDSDKVRLLIDGEYITITQALALTQWQRKALEYENIFSYINRGIITLEQVNLSKGQVKFLGSEQVKKLINDNRITIDQVLRLAHPLMDKDILNRVIAGTLDIRLVHIPSVQYFVNRDLITVERVLSLEEWQANFLNSWQARDLIDCNHITMDQVFELNERQSWVLENTWSYINQGRITVDKALALTWEQKENLKNALNSDEVRLLIYDNHITIDQALALTRDQIMNLKGIYGYINQGLITVERAIDLTGHQASILAILGSKRIVLDFERVRELINGNHITIDQIIEFTPHQLNNLIRAVNDPETWRRLRNGEITVQGVLNRNFNQRIRINNRQSTHTASVHKSVSESASRLFENYGSELNGNGLEEKIAELSEYVQSLPDDSLKNQAAERAITRITAIDYTFSDSRSHISIRQLLALLWVAINDNNEEKLENAKQSLIDALYEIQRGYNLSNSGIDDEDLDDPICTAGTFNKLVERMVGILSECELIFVTTKTAGFKLPIVVKEEALKYLEFAKQSEPESFPQLLTRIQDEGVEIIWGKIQEEVRTRMFDEFGSLFPDGPDSERFCEFIDAGKYTDLGQLISDQFKEDEEDDVSAETHLSFTP